MLRSNLLLHLSARRRHTELVKRASTLLLRELHLQEALCVKINKCISSERCLLQRDLGITLVKHPCRRSSKKTNGKLHEYVGDEVTESFGVLLGVDCGDFSSSLEDTDALVVSVGAAAPPWVWVRVRVSLSPTHPVLDCFGCVSGFLLGVILGEDVYQAHEVDLPLRSS